MRAAWRLPSGKWLSHDGSGAAADDRCSQAAASGVWMGLAAAAVPIICQLVMLLTVELSAADAFPKADKGFIETKFWPVQVVLLCVAISGNAIVDFCKCVIDHHAQNAGVVLQFVFMMIFLLITSILFSVTLLDTEMALSWMIGMTIFGVVGLAMAYRVEMDIAVIEAGLSL